MEKKVPNLPRFKRYTIYTGPPSERTLCVVGDLNNDGQPEIVLASRNPKRELYYLARDAGGQWQRYDMDADFGNPEAGGCLADLTGSGKLDFIAGNDGSGNALFWWECPDDPTKPWTRREIFRMPANKSHDQLVADLDGDGRLEVYFWNQFSETLFFVPVPDDPRLSPWSGIRPIATGVGEEGLAVADIDGDGRLELLAGQSWYKPPATPDGGWERNVFAEGYISTRLAVADFDGDGRVEIVLAEGDASFMSERYFGRLVYFKSTGDPRELWQAEVLHDELEDPHSLIVADFDGDGRPDFFVGELGSPDGDDRHPPTQRIYLNRNGVFEECVIEQGLGTHESKIIEIDGKIGIVCKPYRNVRDDIPRSSDIDSIHLWLPEA